MWDNEIYGVLTFKKTPLTITNKSPLRSLLTVILYTIICRPCIQSLIGWYTIICRPRIQSLRGWVAHYKDCDLVVEGENIKPPMQG